jgi:hypothetical protein
VDHYGLYVDWWKDLEIIAGRQIIEDMVRGPEMYLQLWERARGVPGENCCEVNDGTDLAELGNLEEGMTREEVLFQVGQPYDRTADSYVYCIARGDDIELVELDFADDQLTNAPQGVFEPTPATGVPAVWTLAALALLGAALFTRRRIPEVPA